VRPRRPAGVVARLLNFTVRRAMADRRKGINAALRTWVVPALRVAGFTGSLPHFRRRSEAGTIELLTFQFDKWGGGFVIEIARCPVDGVKTYSGKQVPPCKINAHDAPPNVRHRLQQRAGSGTDSWFRYDDGDYGRCAKEALSKLSEAEAWWASHV